jgi:hypothetical protein
VNQSGRWPKRSATDPARQSRKQEAFENAEHAETQRTESVWWRLIEHQIRWMFEDFRAWNEVFEVCDANQNAGA